MSGMAVGSESIKNHAAFIWSVADLLRGDDTQFEYGKVVPIWSGRHSSPTREAPAIRCRRVTVRGARHHTATSGRSSCRGRSSRDDVRLLHHC